MHSDTLLAKKTAQLVRENFSKHEISNLLCVRWGKPWKSKLGHIKPFKNTEFGSLIEINSVLNDPRVPEFVVEATLLHELIHYFQGFGSNKPRQRRHPHRGGSVQNEMARFGWTQIQQKQDEWVKQNFFHLWKQNRGKQTAKEQNELVKPNSKFF